MFHRASIFGLGVAFVGHIWWPTIAAGSVDAILTPDDPPSFETERRQF